MKFVLQTSSGYAQLYLLDGGRLVARLPDYGQDALRIQERDLASLTRDLLHKAGVTMAQLTGLAVDIGPGRLAATRMAVAFVNALAFARRLPLQALPAFVLLGAEAAAQEHEHALILRKASGARYYWALCEGAALLDQGMCATSGLPQLAARLDAKAATLVSDQALNAAVLEAFGTRPNLTISHASPATLAGLLEGWPAWKGEFTPYPLPLTETAFNAGLE